MGHHCEVAVREKHSRKPNDQNEESCTIPLLIKSHAGGDKQLWLPKFELHATFDEEKHVIGRTII